MAAIQVKAYHAKKDGALLLFLKVVDCLNLMWSPNALEINDRQCLPDPMSLKRFEKVALWTRPEDHRVCTKPHPVCRQNNMFCSFYCKIITCIFPTCSVGRWRILGMFPHKRAHLRHVSSQVEHVPLEQHADDASSSRGICTETCRWCIIFQFHSRCVGSCANSVNKFWNGPHRISEFQLP